MHGIGLREWVALGVLGVAAAFGFMFMDPSATNGHNAGPGSRRTTEVVFRGPEDTPAPVASAAPSPTAAAVAKLGEPGSEWQVAYYDSAEPGEGVRAAHGKAASLEIDEAGAPFPDFGEDGWRLLATQRMDLAAGRYGFVLESDGALRVQAGDTIIINVEDSPERQTHALEFDHAGGAVILVIELRDTGGPAYLRWSR